MVTSLTDFSLFPAVSFLVDMSPMPVVPMIASAVPTGATGTRTSHHRGWKAVSYAAS
ncbi:hypothetical protein V8F44DRAFT_607838 [Aspergillus fumigatus]